MSELVKRIESILKEKGLTFSRVERECGLGNGTIKRWSEQSPRLDKLIVISQYLEVSLDYLVFGILHSEITPFGDEQPNLCHIKERQSLIYDGSPLNEMEADVVAMYRLLPDLHKEEIFDLLYFKYTRHVEEKKGSIYSAYLSENKLFKNELGERQKPHDEIA